MYIIYLSRGRTVAYTSLSLSHTHKQKNTHILLLFLCLPHTLPKYHTLISRWLAISAPASRAHAYCPFGLFLPLPLSLSLSIPLHSSTNDDPSHELYAVNQRGVKEVNFDAIQYPIRQGVLYRLFCIRKPPRNGKCAFPRERETSQSLLLATSLCPDSPERVAKQQQITSEEQKG